MRARIKVLAQRIDALSLRERTLLMLTVLAVLCGIWYALLYQPLLARSAASAASLNQIQQRLQQTSQQLQAILPKGRGSPNEQARKELASLKAEIAANEHKLETVTTGLIPPERMAEVLKTLLLEEPGLRLISVQSRAARPLVKAEKHGPLFTHGLVLTFDGRYAAVMRYLNRVEALPWRLDWDSIRIDTRHYPINRITLQVHTISFSEAWLGT